MILDDIEESLQCHKIPNLTRETINVFSREQVWVDDGKAKL
jgi:hypothetical protein